MQTVDWLQSILFLGFYLFILLNNIILFRGAQFSEDGSNGALMKRKKQHKKQ